MDSALEADMWLGPILTLLLEIGWPTNSSLILRGIPDQLGEYSRFRKILDPEV